MYKKIAAYLIFFLFFNIHNIYFSNSFAGQVLYRTGPFFGTIFSGNPEQGAQSGIEIFNRIKFDTMIDYEIKNTLIAGLIKKESSYILHSVSSSNALGVFQMKPFFADELGISNPFDPNSEKEIIKKIEIYKRDLGNYENALSGYHIGYYGTKSLIEKGINPLSKTNVSSYVNKILEYKRHYSTGDVENLYDYLWIGIEMNNFPGYNTSSITTVLPELWFGSFSVVANISKGIDLDLYNELFINSNIQIVIGYKNDFTAGICFRTNDWKSFVNLEYVNENRSIKWNFKQNIDNFNYGLGFSADDLYFEIGYNFRPFYINAGIHYNGDLIPFLALGGKY